MTATKALRDRLLVALSATGLTGCITDQACPDDAEPQEMRPSDAAPTDGALDHAVADSALGDARAPVDYATPEPCARGDFRCAPQVDGACLPTTSSAWELHEFFEPTDSPVCGVDLHTGPFPPPEGESEPCCYCLTIQQCGGRPFVVARTTQLALAVQRADWS